MHWLDLDSIFREIIQYWPAKVLHKSTCAQCQSFPLNSSVNILSWMPFSHANTPNTTDKAVWLETHTQPNHATVKPQREVMPLISCQVLLSNAFQAGPGLSLSLTMWLTTSTPTKNTSSGYLRTCHKSKNMRCQWVGWNSQTHSAPSINQSINLSLFLSFHLSPFPFFYHTYTYIHSNICE